VALSRHFRDAGYRTAALEQQGVTTSRDGKVVEMVAYESPDEALAAVQRP
jgi:hypothetical protein